uniref:Uncharacterized protein n=1 Tax=Paramormyrops kingsleyae TaxID=1676925 RepID=A0A3B3SHR8_9TELE
MIHCDIFGKIPGTDVKWKRGKSAGFGGRSEESCQRQVVPEESRKSVSLSRGRYSAGDSPIVGGFPLPCPAFCQSKETVLGGVTRGKWGSSSDLSRFCCRPSAGL